MSSRTLNCASRILVRNPRFSHSGFSLIEVMIAVAVIGVVLGVGLPAIGDWIQNRQVNALAESIASGIRLAQSEAVQRNVQVEMVLTTSDVTAYTPNVAANASNDPSTATLTAGSSSFAKTDASPNWMVRVTGATTIAGFIQGKLARDGSENARFSGPAGVRFSPLGRVSASIAANGAAAVPAGSLQLIVVNPYANSSQRTQRCINVSTGGSVKICDPRAASGDPRACLPTCTIGTY